MYFMAFVAFLFYGLFASIVNGTTSDRIMELSNDNYNDVYQLQDFNVTWSNAVGSLTIKEIFEIEFETDITSQIDNKYPFLFEIANWSDFERLPDLQIGPKEEGIQWQHTLTIHQSINNGDASSWSIHNTSPWIDIIESTVGKHHFHLKISDGRAQDWTGNFNVIGASQKIWFNFGVDMQQMVY